MLDSDVTLYDDPYKYLKQPPFQDLVVMTQAENDDQPNSGVACIQVTFTAKRGEYCSRAAFGPVDISPANCKCVFPSDGQSVLICVFAVLRFVRMTRSLFSIKSFCYNMRLQLLTSMFCT